MEHREAILLLVDYVRGELDESRRRAVADHLAAHPDCAETVRFLERLDQDLVRHGAGLVGEHPAADSLVTYAVGDADELEPVEHAAVARHVEDCPACFRDLQMVRRVHAALVAPAPTKGKPSTGSGRLGGLPMLGAALAAGLVLGLGLPQLFGGGRDQWDGPVSVCRVSGTVRSGTAIEAAVPAGAEALPVIVTWDPWTLPGACADTPLTIRLGDAAERRELWRLDTTVGAAFDGPNGAIAFLVPLDEVGFGERILTVGPAGGPPEVTARLSLTRR